MGDICCIFCTSFLCFPWCNLLENREFTEASLLIYFSQKTEKTQLVKQKSGLSSKRGEKRNLKVSLKTKSDSLSTDAGNGSAAAGSSFLGMMISCELLVNMLKILHLFRIYGLLRSL